MKPLDVGMYGNRFGSRRCIVAAAMAETDVVPCKSIAGGSVTWSQVDRRYHRQCRSGAIWLLLATLVGLVAVSQAAAQDYELIEINPRFVLPEEGDFESRRDYRDEYRKIKSQTSDARDNVQDALKAGSTNFSADGDLYLREYRIAQMTQPKELYISNLGRLRTEFLREFLGSRAAPQTRQPMIQKLLPMLEDIVKGNYHPAVRLNAVTLIGLLDDTEGDSSQPPRPSAAAYESLKRIWSNPNSPEAVKVGAMSGIRRFAELSRMGATGIVQGSDLKTELTAIANGQAAGQDKWSTDLSYWLQRRATQILGYIGEGDDVVSTLTSVIKSAPADGGRDNFWLRYDALQSLANLKFNQLNSEQVQPLIDDVLGFAAFAMEREATMLEKSVQDLVYVNILWADTDLEQGGKRPRRPAGGMPGGGRGGGLPGGGGKAGSIGGLGSTGAGGGAAGFGGGDAGGGLPGGGARGGGLPPGGGRGGRGGGAFGGGRPGQGDAMKKDKVELPVFELNDSRTRIKAVLVTARTFLKEFRYDIGIVTAADQETAQRINEQLLPAIDELLKKTELGVIDYRELRGEEPEEIDTTSELTQVYKNGAAQLRKLITVPPEKDAGQPVAQGLSQ